MWVASTNAQDLCAHPELMLVAKGAHCRGEPILYRLNGRTEAAELATVTTGYRRDFDVMSPLLIYFLRTPDGKVIPLGAFPPARSHAPSRIYQQLQYNPALGGGLARTNASNFYDRLIEKGSDQYCMVYRMKSPFTGEFYDCDGQANPGGRIGYAPATIAPADAGRRICELVAAETSQVCGNNSVEVIHNSLQRDADGHVSYRIVPRRRIRDYPELKETTSYGYSVPVEYEQRTYALDSSTGKVSFLGRESMLCGEKCKPLPWTN